MDLKIYLLVLLINVIIDKIQALPRDGVNRSPNKRQKSVKQLSDRQRAWYTKVFSVLDKNGDGEVNATEFGTKLRSHGVKNIETVVGDAMTIVEADGSGNFTLPEYLAAVKAVYNLREKFPLIDLNGDGNIEGDELRAVLTLLLVGETFVFDKYVERAMEVIDTNGNGKISLEEYRAQEKRVQSTQGNHGG